MATGAHERTALAIGPWGGTGGTEWYDLPHGEIQEIHLSYDRAVIWSFKAFYIRNGETHEGHNDERNLERFENVQIQLLQGERIVQVSGNIGPWPAGAAAPMTVVRSLTFKTNYRRNFGPYGNKAPVRDGSSIDFNVPIENGFVAGFKGRSGDVLDAIGLYISPN